MKLVTVFALVGFASAATPEVKCPVPVSPVNGQVFLSRGGSLLKYGCNTGYELDGSDVLFCSTDGQWDPEPPTCRPTGSALSMAPDESVAAPMASTERPLFKWDDEQENKTDLQGDEARLHLILYPESHGLTQRVQRVRSESSLEEEEKRRSTKEKPANKQQVEKPSVVYVRRALSPGKIISSEQALRNQYRRAAVRMVVDGNHENGFQVISMPRAHVSEDDKGGQSEEALRYSYWMAQNLYPRQAVVASPSGHPVAVTLSESQMAWINSLHPEMRDRYMKDLYSLRSKEAEEGVRAQAFLRRYGDAYHWMYHSPYYARQALEVVEDPVSTFDYSCHTSDRDGRTRFIRAPALANAHVYRYDKRRNPNPPRNDYLVADYRCNPGYIMLDARSRELFCSRRGWVGTQPICVARG